MSDLGSYVSVTKPTGPTFHAWLYSAWFHQILEGDTRNLLCSVVWHYHQSYVQHYMANLMFVQCVIAIHAEV